MHPGTRSQEKAHALQPQVQRATQVGGLLLIQSLQSTSRADAGLLLAAVARRRCGRQRQRNCPARKPAPLNGQRTAAPDAAGASHHPEHSGRATAPVYEPALVSAKSAANRLDGAAGGGDWVLCLTRLRALDPPRHITAAFSALAHQQQVATLDGAAEIGDRCFVTAVPIPDVGPQSLAGVGGDRLPALAGGGRGWGGGGGCLVKVGSFSIVRDQGPQRRASLKSSSIGFSRSGDAMNP